MEIYYYRSERNVVDKNNDSEKRNKIKELLKENIKSSNLCFLLGSGCSVGAIPLMGKTFSKLKEENKDKEFLLERYKDSDDIEGYLNWLNKGIEFLAEKSEVNKYKEFFNIIKKGLIRSIEIDYNQSNAINVLNTYIKFFNKIFDERICVTSEPINIFTTNYDLFNEKALEILKIEYTNGFSGYVDRIFSPYSFNFRIVDEENRYKDKWSPIKRYAKIYKIHGSIDWVYKNEKILQKHQINEENESNNVLIYPLQTKHFDTQQSPYSELFREMNIKLQKRNTTLIVIGYGFPDEHINNLISQALVNNDFNLIVFSDINEVNPKKFYERHKEKPNFHFIGGDLSPKDKLHYFNKIVELLGNEITGKEGKKE